MFEQSRDKYKDNENKLLIAKVIDKYEFKLREGVKRGTVKTASQKTF